MPKLVESGGNVLQFKNISYILCFVSYHSPRYLQEHCRLRTGGGIYHFRDQILSGNPSAFFVFNSDVCCNFPVKDMYEFQRNTNGGKICVMLGTEVCTCTCMTTPIIILIIYHIYIYIIYISTHMYVCTYIHTVYVNKKLPHSTVITQ